MNLAKTYTPNDYEPTTYALWETSGVFSPKGKGEPYAIVMPPPNANGNLHVGHALGDAIEDILVRYHRMRGYDAVYIPGADHAGFETWVVYEKELEKQGKSRFDFSRDQLYAQVWDFVAARRGDMELQLRALGVGADWGSLVFTLDQKVTDTVYDTFKQLLDDKLVYRGERIVNFCTTHQTAFADIEVVHKNEKGKLWNIAYTKVDGSGEIIIATTRPETLLGDTAIAVHPGDERYASSVGSKAEVPLTGRTIEVVADSYVDQTYGSGVVKVTPAHDPNDFDIGERHNLEILQVIDFDGRMINVPEEFLGKTVEDARALVLGKLEAEGRLRGEQEIEHAVGHCYKCGTVIQPLVKDQWFLRMAPLAEKAISAINAGEVNFYPENRGRVLVDYLKNLKDWNLSRQIPWGIPIPIFFAEDDPKKWIYDRRVGETKIVVDGTTYIRDEDTFDTWFSSGQWPFITTDYLTGGDLARFYPNAVMETGFDILFAWVGRMIMLGLYRTGRVPFRDVYLHGMVNDEHNQKMSKSKGNVLNPMELVAEYGSDALRLGIIANRSAAQSQAFSRASIIAGRNFCNKLWNIARFIESQIGDYTPMASPEPRSMADHWIVRQLSDATAQIEQQLTGYRFAEAGETLYKVIWNDVADWYVEVAKTEKNLDMLAWVLDTSLRLAHPFTPFVTETIWQSLGWRDTILAGEKWPETGEYSQLQAAEFERLMALISEARFVSNDLPGNDRYTLLYMDDALIADNAGLIQRLARVETVEHTDQARGLRLAVSGRDAWLDVDAETLYEHQSNLEGRLADARSEVELLEKRLANESYVTKAPKELVEASRRDLDDKKALLTRLRAELDVIAGGAEMSNF